MRQAARQGRAAKQKVSIMQTYPAPVGGWNARDALASMKPIDAVVLNNWFPRASFCEMRGGWASHVTGMTGTAKTLMVYNKLTGSNQMFCATNQQIWNVSSAAGAPSSLLARTNGKQQWVMFGD